MVRKRRIARWLDPYWYRVDPKSWSPDNPGEYTLERLNSSGSEYISQSGIGRGADNTFYFHGQLNYENTFGEDHGVTAMLMYMQREYRNDVLPNRNQGLSGRLTYAFRQKYLAEFNFGYNGTERLDKGKRFEFFPAMSLGWVVSSEKFWQPLESMSITSRSEVHTVWSVVMKPVHTMAPPTFYMSIM